jgi:translation initiation factor IF-2
VPQAGDEFMVLADERQGARDRHLPPGQVPRREAGQAAGRQAREHVRADGRRRGADPALIIKADVQGSQEALAQSLLKLSTDEVKVQIVHAAVGGISESDVNLAIASKAVIIGFNTCGPMPARASWPRQRRRHPLLQHHLRRGRRVKAAMTGMLAPEQREESSARPRSARCSWPPRSARWPAAWSPTAWCAAARASACCARTS